MPNSFRKQTGGTQRETGLGVCEQLNCGVMGGNSTYGDDYFTVYTDIELQCTPETDIQAYLFYCVLLYRTLQILCFFYKVKVLLQSTKRVYWCSFSNSICSLWVPVSYFDSSCNISNIFLLIIFSIVILTSSYIYQELR